MQFEGPRYLELSLFLQLGSFDPGIHFIILYNSHTCMCVCMYVYILLRAQSVP